MEMSIPESIDLLGKHVLDMDNYEATVVTLESVMKSINESNYDLTYKEKLTMTWFYIEFRDRGLLDNYLELQRTSGDTEKGLLFFVFTENSDKWNEDHIKFYLKKINTIVRLRELVIVDVIIHGDNYVYGDAYDLFRSIHSSITFQIRILKEGVPVSILNDVMVSDEMAAINSKIVREMHLPLPRRKIIHQG